MLFTGPHIFTMDKWISCAPFEKLLNIEIVKAENGEAVLRLPFLHDFAQGAGLMHGGVLVSLADTTVVMAIKSILEPMTHFATIKLETEFFKPIKKGYVTCRGKVGKSYEERILIGSAKIFDEQDQDIAIFNSTFKIAKNAEIKNIKFLDAPK